MRTKILVCFMSLFLLGFSSMVQADDLCQKYHSLYRTCVEKQNAGREIDYETCKGYSDPTTCQNNGCTWWDAPSAYPCMLDICLTEVTGDGKVKLGDLAITMRELGRTGCPAPPPPVFNTVPKTGQTTSYDATRDGEDGDLQKGVLWPNPRFTITYCDESGECTDQGSDCDENSSTDVVTDNLTGLMWSRDAWLSQDSRTWQGSLDYVDGMNDGGGLCGHTDWRLPNVRELQSLVHYGVDNPAVPNTEGTDKCTNTGDPFINVQSYGYWSSTTYAGSTDGAWVVSMSSGVVGYGTKSNYGYVWPVRGGQ